MTQLQCLIFAAASFVIALALIGIDVFTPMGLGKFHGIQFVFSLIGWGLLIVYWFRNLG